MEVIQIARRLAECGQKDEACKAYLLVLQQAAENDPETEMEAASYIFFSEGDYRVAYTAFVSLYNRGFYQNELFDLMTQAFYQPNVDEQRKRYMKNCEYLTRYPYLFRKDFEDFDSLPISFFPFDDNGYIPFFKAENRFGSYINFNDPVIDRYFFKNLEKPILAEDVYSQYQLEYLNDTVRKSEWIGRENHIYLHYTDWKQFCTYLQCLSFADGLLRDRKQVFLIDEEIDLYPIDFKERFGIDYSKYELRPVGIREVNRLIWHTQLASHNGGDFFNEILYEHPNLLSYDSLMMDSVEKSIREMREELKQNKSMKGNFIRMQLQQLKTPTDKDFLVALFLGTPEYHRGMDKQARIAPALMFQPHFHNVMYNIFSTTEGAKCLLISNEYEEIKKMPMLNQFKYIKTFTPMRRITTSHAASVRFMTNIDMQSMLSDDPLYMQDELSVRLRNRSFMIDKQDRLYHDSVLVRFEDGKLNPKATFTALAEFLDIPYTQSMTYCSYLYQETDKKNLKKVMKIYGDNKELVKQWENLYNNMDEEAAKKIGRITGFDPVTVYRTYDEFANDDERAFLEYFMRDAYEAYGYDFKYYKGESVDEAWVMDKIEHFDCIDGLICKMWDYALRKTDYKDLPQEEQDALVNERIKNVLLSYREGRINLAKLLMRGLRFINQQNQPLQMMPLLKLDPALLEQPLYH